MLEYEFEDSVGHWICMAARLFEQAMNDELEPHGITFRQCQVLAWLAIEGDLSQTELADRMRIEPPTLVGILDRMEREDWIGRETCVDDRRRKLIRPCAKAQPVWSKIVECAHRVRQQAVEGLSDDELATLKRLLGVIHANLTAARAQRVPASQPSAN